MRRPGGDDVVEGVGVRRHPDPQAGRSPAAQRSAHSSAPAAELEVDDPDDPHAPRRRRASGGRPRGEVPSLPTSVTSRAYAANHSVSRTTESRTGIARCISAVVLSQAWWPSPLISTTGGVAGDRVELGDRDVAVPAAGAVAPADDREVGVGRRSARRPAGWRPPASGRRRGRAAARPASTGRGGRAGPTGPGSASDPRRRSPRPRPAGRGPAPTAVTVPSSTSTSTGSVGDAGRPAPSGTRRALRIRWLVTARTLTRAPSRGLDRPRRRRRHARPGRVRPGRRRPARGPRRLGARRHRRRAPHRLRPQEHAADDRGQQRADAHRPRRRAGSPPLSASSGSAPSASSDAVRDVERLTRTARPSAPPIMNEVLTTPEASPDSCGSTSPIAASSTGLKAMPGAGAEQQHRGQHVGHEAAVDGRPGEERQAGRRQRQARRPAAGGCRTASPAGRRPAASRRPSPRWSARTRGRPRGRRTRAPAGGRAPRGRTTRTSRPPRARRRPARPRRCAAEQPQRHERVGGARLPAARTPRAARRWRRAGQRATEVQPASLPPTMP